MAELGANAKAGCLALLLLAACYIPAAAACKTCLKSLLVLGDSSSDGGLPYGLWSYDNSTVPLARLGYDSGRFSNGPVWPEYVAYTKQVSVLNLAVAGASVNEVSSITLAKEVANATALLSAKPLAQPSAAVIFIGVNDFIYLPPNILNNVTALMAFLANVPAGITAAAHTLQHQLGFKNIFIANVPALHLSPYVTVLGPQVQATTLALLQVVNNGIAAAVKALAASSPKGTNIMLWDTFEFVSHAVAHPPRGNNVTHSCLVTTTPAVTDPTAQLVSTCKDPSKYLFWDTLHPTTATHHNLAKDVIRVGKRHRLFRY